MTPLAIHVEALLESLGRRDFEALPPAVRRRFADQARRCADLAERCPDAPETGVLADLRRQPRDE